MATTVKNSAFVSSISDNVTLNGTNYGNTNAKSYVSCNEAVQRIVTIPKASGSQDFVSLFGANLTPDSAGDVTFSEFKYARITNLDDTNSIFIQLTDQDGSAGSGTVTAAVVFEIPAGMSFLIPSGQFDVAHNAALAGTSYTSSTVFNTKMKVLALAITADVDVEFLAVTA
tara:strand:- start:7855 stop:8367 length:513 start_codon:yes stop_codon:yes gene_type:complete